MDDIICKLDSVRNALGTLNITSTRRNMDVLLGSMQILDKVISSIGKLAEAEKKEGLESG